MNEFHAIMATSQTTFHVFNPDDDAIEQYLERFQLHCIVQDVKEEEEKKICLTANLDYFSNLRTYARCFTEICKRIIV